MWFQGIIIFHFLKCVLEVSKNKWEKNQQNGFNPSPRPTHTFSLSEPLKSGRFLHLDPTFDFIWQKKNIFFIKCIQRSSIFNSFLNRWMKDLIMNVHETSSTIRQQDYAPTGIIQIQVPHSSCWLTRVLILEGLASSEEDRVKLSIAFVTEMIS